MQYHKCKPVWLVAIICGEEQPADDDYVEVRGFDAEEAAIVAAEEDDCNSAEYAILRHYDCDYYAWVKETHESKPQRFKITGEAVPQYYAEEIKE